MEGLDNDNSKFESASIRNLEGLVNDSDVESVPNKYKLCAFSSKVLPSTKINSDCDNEDRLKDLSIETKLDKVNSSKHPVQLKPNALGNDNRQKTAFLPQKTMMTKSNTKFISNINQIEDEDEEIKHQTLDEDTVELIKNVFHC